MESIFRSKEVNAEESEKIGKGLDAFFKGAGLTGWKGAVNEDVATVYTVMICAAHKKTAALH